MDCESSFFNQHITRENIMFDTVLQTVLCSSGSFFGSDLQSHRFSSASMKQLRTVGAVTPLQPSLFWSRQLAQLNTLQPFRSNVKA